MSGFTIEKDVPIPIVKRGGKSKYPFADMEPGDSFPIAKVKKADASRTLVAVRVAARQWAARNAPTARFVADYDEAKSEVRVWLQSV